MDVPLLRPRSAVRSPTLRVALLGCALLSASTAVLALRELDTLSVPGLRRRGSIWQPLASVLHPTNATRQMDLDFCGRTPCRTIIVEMTAEQETKALLHIQDLAWLASKTGRDLVLPNGSASRYGIRHDVPFEMFHSIEGLRFALSLPTHTRFYTKSQYLAFAKRRYDAGDGILYEQLTVREKALISYQRNWDMFGILHSSPKPRDLASWLELSRADPAKRCADTIAWFADRPAEALSVHWDAYTLFCETPRRKALRLGPNESIPTPFSALVVDAAEAILEPLGTTLVMHWRLEAVVPIGERLPPFVTCAGEAVDLIAAHPEVDTVILVHDYPDAHGGSGTFITLNREWPEYGVAALEGLDALRRLLEERSIKLVTLSDLDPHIEFEGRDRPIVELDRGLLSIVAKIVATRADVFIVGEPKRCGRRSNFSQQIVRTRSADRKQVVEYFPSAFPRNRAEAQLAYSQARLPSLARRAGVPRRVRHVRLSGDA